MDINQKIDMFDAVASNKRKTWLLLILFSAFVFVVGYAAGFVLGNAYFGLVIAGVLLGIQLILLFTKGDQLILKMNNARELPRDDTNYIYNLVESVSLAAGMSKPPKVYIIEDDSLNAFATGRKPEKSAIALTRGLINKLDRDELEGVIAHEISHVVNYDILISTTAIMLVGVISLLAGFLRRRLFWTSMGRGRRRSSKSGSNNSQAIMMIVSIVVIILAPLFAQILNFAISRKREYLADANGAILTRNPKGLAGALRKISGDTAVFRSANEATENLYIAKPLKKDRDLSRRDRKSLTGNWFSTHPPIADRIKKLESM